MALVKALGPTLVVVVVRNHERKEKKIVDKNGRYGDRNENENSY
jgi:hypothetical protein